MKHAKIGSVLDQCFQKLLLYLTEIMIFGNLLVQRWSGKLI